MVVIANELFLPKDPGRIKNTIHTPSLKFGTLSRQVPLREWNWIGYSCSHSLLVYCVSGTLHAPCKTKWNILVSSVHSVVSDSSRPHGLHYARPICPSPTPKACSNSCPSSLWCHPTISSSAVPFSSHLQSFPASRSFPMSLFFTLGSQSIGVWASASVLPMNTQDWFPLGLTGLILLSKGFSKVFFSNTVWKHQVFGADEYLFSNSCLKFHVSL